MIIVHTCVVFIIFTLTNRLMKKLQLTLPTCAQVYATIRTIRSRLELLIVHACMCRWCYSISCDHYQNTIDNLAMGNAVDITLCQNTSVQQSDDEITCVVGFYLDNSTRPVCTPHCKSWLNISTSDIVITVCLSLSIITCIVLFIIVRFQRHTM